MARAGARSGPFTHASERDGTRGPTVAADPGGRPRSRPLGRGAGPRRLLLCGASTMAMALARPAGAPGPRARPLAVRAWGCTGRQYHGPAGVPGLRGPARLVGQRVA